MKGAPISSVTFILPSTVRSAWFGIFGRYTQSREWTRTCKLILAMGLLWEAQCKKPLYLITSWRLMFLHPSDDGCCSMKIWQQMLLPIMSQALALSRYGGDALKPWFLEEVAYCFSWKHNSYLHFGKLACSCAICVPFLELFYSESIGILTQGGQDDEFLSLNSSSFYSDAGNFSWVS